MRIVVFGASGAAGKAIVASAHDQGHDVVAFGERPEELGKARDGVTVVQGDVADLASVRKAIAGGADAVVSALEAPDRSPTQLYSGGVANILVAMREQGVSRLVALSHIALDPTNPGLSLGKRLMNKAIAQKLFLNVFNDLRRMEDELRASDVDWTVVRVPPLADDGATGSYRVAIDGHVPKPQKVAGDDLAKAILDHVTDPATHRRVIEVSR